MRVVPVLEALGQLLGHVQGFFRRIHHRRLRGVNLNVLLLLILHLKLIKSEMSQICCVALTSWHFVSNILLFIIMEWLKFI